MGSWRTMQSKKIAARHAAAGRNCQVAFGINQRIAFGVDRSVEISRNQHFQSIELPAFPFLRRKAEHGIVRINAFHIQSHGNFQIVVQHPQHLERLANAHGALLKTVIVAQGCDAANMHAGDGSSTKIDGNAIRLLVVQRGR